ncbi:DNAJ heat shock N-terminal domain-containing-like protein [Theobroma cacao]|uniref:DNAJ heat shock N-terminal domain-containing-like protein n=1 Tax=Theobroma cacao TaxID=3641 RepID=A0A061ER64_THECC|nr:DNAJ heat shock N-terminal domain-containing-like protein [Theobroma cacao]
MKDQGQFGGSSRSHSQCRSSAKSIRAINSEGKQYYESIIEEVASLLQGAIKVGFGSIKLWDRENTKVVCLFIQREFHRNHYQGDNQSVASGSRNSMSYILLDATKQPSFLSVFDKSGFKSPDHFLVAYKPRKGNFAAYMGDMTMEEIEIFIGSVLNGDIQFTRT